MLKKILIVIGLIALLPAVCIAGRVNVKRLNKAKWVYFETENFEVLTDAKEETALEIVRELEHFKFFLSTILRYAQKPISERVTVVAAKNGKTFKSIGIPVKYAAGLFLNQYGNTILTRCDGFRSSSNGESNIGRHIVLHELSHVFSHNSSPELALPPWYDEGIADYFGTYLEKNGGIILGDISIMKSRFYSMLDSRGDLESVDTESLFKTSKMDLDAALNSSKHVKYINRFYARAFMVVHYILGDLDRMENLVQYLKSLQNGLSVDDSFKHAFKKTFVDFDEEIDGYIGGKLTLRFYNPEIMGVKFPGIECKKRDISKQDVLALLFTKISVLPDTMLGDGNYEKLICDIEKLYPGLVDKTIQKKLSTNSESNTALLEVATIYRKMHKYRETIDVFERALLFDEGNASLLNDYAWILATMPDMELRNPTKAIELAEKAVAIKRIPSFLDTLAEAYYSNGSLQKAIETINEAISLARKDNEYLNKQLKKFKKAQTKL